MGQLKALLYKQLIITRGQYIGLCCQCITPIFALLAILVIQTKINDLIPAGKEKDTVFPAYFSISNVLKPNYNLLSNPFARSFGLPFLYSITSDK